MLSSCFVIQFLMLFVDLQSSELVLLTSIAFVGAADFLLFCVSVSLLRGLIRSL